MCWGSLVGLGMSFWFIVVLVLWPHILAVYCSINNNVIIRYTVESNGKIAPKMKDTAYKPTSACLCMWWGWGCVEVDGSQRLARTYAFKLLCLAHPSGTELNIVIIVDSYKAAQN